MKIDEERKFSLTKYSGKIGNKKIVPSDHNLLILEVVIGWDTKENSKPRETIFNFKSKDNFKKFVEVTEDNTFIQECFEDKRKVVENYPQYFILMF